MTDLLSQLLDLLSLLLELFLLFLDLRLLFLDSVNQNDIQTIVPDAINLAFAIAERE